MNLAACNWKILTVAKHQNLYKFNLAGYALQRQEVAELVCGDHVVTVRLEDADRTLVPFAPEVPGVHRWMATCELVEDSVPPEGVVLTLKTTADNYPLQFWCLSPQPWLVVPPDDNVRRVSGQDSNRTTYRNAGRTEYLRYKELLDRHLVPDHGRVLLDWGVGCARVAQHFMHAADFEVHGIDIDSTNVDWCRTNLPQLRAAAVPLIPPTAMASASFDVIISSSVLSHLIPAHWQQWLKEMRRLLRKNGLCLFSFHGDNSCAVMIRPDTAAKSALSRDGWFDLAASRDLGAEFEDYYRNTVYLDSYARVLAGENFDVVDIVPGYLSGSQSVLVMRAR